MRVIAHKTKVYPNKTAREYLARCFGTSRFAYNWAIATTDQHYQDIGKSLSPYDIRNKLNAIKKTEFPWMYDVSKHVVCNATLDAGNAFRRFFKKQAKHPRFHKKGFNDSFRISAENIDLRPSGRTLRIPKLKSSIRMAESLRFPGKVLSVTISRKAEQYFASFQVQLPEDYIYPHRCESQATIGVDLGIKDFAVLSTGEKIEGPKALRRHEVRLKRLQRSLSRKQIGSRNRAKARLKLTKKHLKIRNIRSDFLHKLSTDLVKRFQVIGIEDLAVSNMVSNHKLAKAISDQGWREFRRQLEYKAVFSGSEVVLADRWYPSSRLCSVCGHKKEDLKLLDREWTCSFCGTGHDRDINAAMNLRKLAEHPAERINACGAAFCRDEAGKAKEV